MTSHRWKRFFIDAGLPSDIADNYAIIFTENRIRFDMLDELNKEILYDMKIKKMGDVISILRHAKEVHTNSYREKVFSTDDSTASAKDKDSSQGTSKTFHQADSTISSNNNVQKQSDSRTTGIPSTRIVKAPMFPKRNSSPTIIRNVTGLNAIIPARKRIEPPTDDDDDNNDVSTSASKMMKTTTSTNPQIRNKIEAQSRLTKFSNQIQNAIISNQSNKSSLLQNPSIQNRLSTTTTTITHNSRLDIRKNDTLFNKTIQQRSNPIQRNTSVSTTVSSIKDRLGKKPVFERIESRSPQQQQRSTVYDRLGMKKSSEIYFLPRH
ncbi:hypothetical protein DERP_002749 [Dermatophagoides pteronyssinus]|uniref:SAM domain-containing protein n=1 Tax=Dermatophagoides pteronyssinus TaxID=6956 RepID=A0ABQ8JVL3_DERPT|nr:hypothetical protein DERP_002749 [Dermatophagoides pteronyssinus]